MAEQDCPELCLGLEVRAERYSQDVNRYHALRQ